MERRRRKARRLAGAVRLGLVGCGKAGQKYLQALVHLSEAQLVATFDPDFEAAGRAATAFDAPAFDDLSAMLRQMDIEGIVVASPNDTHRGIIEIAAAAGVSALVEQPFALSYRDAVAMRDMGRRAGIVLASAHALRLLPSVDQLVSAVRGQRLGTLVQATAQVVSSRSQSYFDETPWRQQMESSGGLTFSEAMAVLDILIYVMGPVREVFALANRTITPRPIEDVLSATMVFESGALATLSATTAAMKAHAEERIALIGTHGSAMVGPTLQGLEGWRIDGDDEQSVCQKIMDLPARTSWQGNWDALHDFVQALGEGIEPGLTVDQSLNTIACAEAIVRSLRDGRPLAVTEVVNAGE